MHHLLVWLVRQTVPADPYLERLLGAFPTVTGPLEATVPTRREAQDGLIEQLTARELEVLQLLEVRLSNREIAKILYISPETAKKHLDNIYQKLQVRGRREAVSRAVALGILRPSVG